MNNDEDVKNTNEQSECAIEKAETADGARKSMVLPVVRLDELGLNTIIDETEVARIFGRCRKSVKRSVNRGELPPPVKTFKQDTWLVGSIVAHMRARMDSAAKDKARLARRPV